MKLAPAVYVHVPFCETKCPYCDFNSFALEGRDVDGYLDALRAELDARPPPSDPPTIFIGGGTPTVVEPDQLARYLDDLFARFSPDETREVTVEANPGSLTREKIALLAERGVTRVSLGVQSLIPRHLETLGRVHSVADVEDAVGWLRDASAFEVSLDFIFAVPGMTKREWADTLDRALAWRPDHLSCYALTYEPGTPFHAWRATGRLRVADEESELAMFRFTERRARAAGLRRYEISNFATPGRECRHNLNYWRNGAYVGYGAGAVSYVDGERVANERSLSRYAEGIRARGRAFTWSERLVGEAAAREMVVLGLRTVDGVDLHEVDARFDVDCDALFGEIVERLANARLVVRANGRLKLARRGWRLADAVSAEFV